MGSPMTIQHDVLCILDEVLGLAGRAHGFDASTPLLGAIPQLDSMAVVSLIGRLEEAFDIVVEDDDVDGQTFATVGSLVDLVSAKVGA
jgi:acyl carrier protein